MTPEANSDNDPTIPAMAPRNWPGLGSERADTLQPFYDHTWNFDNQSDDIAQLLTLPSGPVHPILQGPNGPITMFPDHMHEGEVITPWRFDDTLTFNGQSFVEYPVGALNAYDPGGWQEKPIIIAGGDVINGHSTPREEGKPCEGAFRADPAQTIGKRINVLCAYDGRNAETTTYFQSPGVGRVVTDSSFHHYLDLNLIGHPCGVGAKTQGFRTPAGTEVLAGLKAFFVNTVVWLANIPRLALTLDQTSVIGGLQAATGQCGWSPSPPGGLQINLTSDSPKIAVVPAQVTIQPDSYDVSASFIITTVNVPRNLIVRISADAGGAKGADSANLTVLKQPGPPGAVYSVSFDPNIISFGDSAQCTVTIVPPATPQAVTVALSGVVSPPGTQASFGPVPQSVTIPVGATSYSFTITTSLQRPFRKLITLTVSASAGGRRSKGISPCRRWRQRTATEESRTVEDSSPSLI